MMNRLISAGVLMYCSLSSFAQSSVSPYSMFGTGTIDNGCHGANSGMAGLGIGLRDKNTLNSANPASLTALEPKTFVMDIAVSGSMSGFYGQGQREYTGTGNIDMVGMGFRIGNYVAASIGLTPFSLVEYKIGKSSFMEGKDEKYDTYFTGTGGLHKISLSFGFNIFRDLSVGISGSVIMGQITETEVSDYWTATNKSVCSITAYPDFGIQYHRSVGKYGTLTAGVTGSYRKKFPMHNTYSLTDSDDSTTVSETVRPGTDQSIPAYIGGGISYSGRNFTVGADYVFRKWSAVDSGTDFIQYKDMDKITVGFSYTPDRYDVRKYWKHIKFLLGASADNSCFTVSGVSGFGWAVSAGMILPIRNSTSVYWSLKFERDAFPVYNRNTITENCLKLTVGVSFGESWFVRKHYE